MSLLTISIFATPIAGFTALEDSRPISLHIDHADKDGGPDAKTWLHLLDGTGSTSLPAGAPLPEALYDCGDDGDLSTGVLYSQAPYARGTDLESLIRELHSQDCGPQPGKVHICFLAGTMIATPGGEVPVETLRAGDLVMTCDHGALPLVWATSSRVSPEAIDRSPDQRPIRIEAGALGDGLPRQMVEVSPQHRVLVRHEGREYLISARHLMRTGHPGLSVRREESGFTLVHIALADHQILLASGAAMESFYTGAIAARALGPAQRLSLFVAFPAVARGENPMTPARPFIRSRDYLEMLGKGGMARTVTA